MAEYSAIEWTDHTFNPWVGCTKVGPGCDHCYAEGWAKRSGSVEWGGERRRTSVTNWNLPLKWNRLSANWVSHGGQRTRVFCSSLADVFDNQVPAEWRVDLFDLIRQTPHLDWLLLTKRVANVFPLIREALDVVGQRRGCLVDPLFQWLTGWLRGAPPSNVWLGVTVVNQPEFDRDIDKLMDVPALVRFLSIEPMLGPINLHDHASPCGPFRVDWVICGGESGPGARPMHPNWARSLRNQCAVGGVPFLFKQWGEWIASDQAACPCGPPAGRWLWGDGSPFVYGVREPGVLPLLCRAGKKTAGRLLDGVEHNEFPK